MRAILLTLCLVATATACGGGSKKTTTTPDPKTDPGTVAKTDPPPGDPATATGDAKVTEEQCKELFDHVVPIMLQQASPEEKQQFEDNKAAAEDAMVEQCMAGVTPAMYDCIMKAESADEMQKCGPS